MVTMKKIVTIEGFCKINEDIISIGIEYVYVPKYGSKKNMMCLKSNNQCKYLMEEKCILDKNCEIYKNAETYLEIDVS